MNAQKCCLIFLNKDVKVMHSLLEKILEIDGFKFSGDRSLVCDWNLIKSAPSENTKYYFLKNEVEVFSGLEFKKSNDESFKKDYLPLVEQAQKKIAFLDRDGILVEDTDYPGKIEDIIFNESVLPLLNFLKKSGFEFIVLTNQSGIARDKYTEKDFVQTTAYIKDYYSKLGIEILDTYFCPYHIKGSIERYKKPSFFRKPAPGMALKAAEDHGVDFSKSIMIGDKLTDILEVSFLKYFILKDEAHPNCYKSFEDMIDPISKL